MNVELQDVLGMKILKHPNFFIVINLLNAEEALITYNHYDWNVPIIALEEVVKELESRLYADQLMPAGLEVETHQKLTQMKDDILEESTSCKMRGLFLAHETNQTQPPKSLMQRIKLFLELIKESCYKMAITLLNTIRCGQSHQEERSHPAFYKTV